MMVGVSESVMALAYDVKTQFQGISPKEKAQLMFENGDMFEDRFKNKDTLELTMADTYKAMRSNKQVQ